MRLNSIGLIINPAAGLGAERNVSVARQAINALGTSRILTGPGQLGELAAPGATIVTLPVLTGRAASQTIAQAAAMAEVDALVVVGGDGTMADVAFAIKDFERRCPILGIGAGSINAGDLVTCKAEEVSKLENGKFSIECVHALVAGYNGEDMALAFNDVVIGTTVVGTVDGKLIDLDANEFLNGKQAIGEPKPVGTDTSLVTKAKTSGEATVDVASGSIVGTVIAGFAHQDCFFGKAIVGGVILSAVTGALAGCLVCEQPLVRTQLDQHKLAAVEPVRSAYVSLTEHDTIWVTGLVPPAVLCADGNPLKELEPDDRVHIRVRPGAVDILRLINTG